MIDLNQFRKTNKITRSEMAAFFGVSEPFISQIENGRSKLPESKADLLINNNKGWLVPEGAMVAEPQAPYGTSAQNWPSIVADLSAKIGEQNSQIDRLLSIIETLTGGGK